MSATNITAMEASSRQPTGLSAGAANGAKAPRDLRLDFFRGLAMFIILSAHIPGNTWLLWIPARFGFSDATEIFVFCSGMASALAFGAVFAKKSWLLGSARIAFRVWQVYWAHISVIIATCLLMVLLQWSGFSSGLGGNDTPYDQWPSVAPIFNDTQTALVGLFTLSFVPGLFDILPMYLVILALIPFVMLAHRVGGRAAVFGVVAALWLAAQLGMWHRSVSGEETHALGAALASVGSLFSFLNLPANPWNGDQVWFFNPFGWQIVFFTGFAFGMKWLPSPPVTRRLVMIAALYLVLTVPFAWYQIYAGRYLPEGSALQVGIVAIRDFIEPLRWKTGVGLLRFGHFLALGYLAWAAVGPGGVKLTTGWRAPGAARAVWLWIAGAVALVTIPYAYIEEIKALSPALDAWLFAALADLGLILPEKRIGLAQLAHLFALIVLVWAAIGAARRDWLTGRGFLAAVPVIRQVGTQSLAVFMTSLVLSRFLGFLLDIMGRDVWTRALVNLGGFAVLIATAYLVGWFKSQPWRGARAAQAGPSSAGPSFAGPSFAGPRAKAPPSATAAE